MRDLTDELSQENLDAQAALAKKKLRRPLRPRFDVPRLPSALTSRTDDEVMELLVQFVRHQDYVSGLLAMTEIDESAAEAGLELAKARHMTGAWTGASTDRVAMMKAEAIMDETVQAYDKRVRTLKARRKMYSVLANTLKRNASVCSREITRRVGRNNTERRADRFGGG